MPGWFSRPLEVWRATSVEDEGGGRTETPEQVGDQPLMAKVDQPTARDQLVAAQDGADLTHSIFFDGVVDVQRGDELRGDGESFKVISVVRPSRPRYTKANCEIRQSEAS